MATIQHPATESKRQARVQAHLAALRDHRRRMERAKAEEAKRTRWHQDLQARSIPLDDGTRVYIQPRTKRELASTLVSLAEAGHKIDSRLLADKYKEFARRFARLWCEVLADLPPSAQGALEEAWRGYRRKPLPDGFPEIPYVFIVPRIAWPDDGTDDIVHGQSSPCSPRITACG